SCFSGGGTMASYLMALDERIQCACVGLFFSSRLRTLELTGPSDGCQQMPYEGREQIEGADLVLAMAPRPVIILDGKYDFVDHWGALQSFEDLQKAYTVLGCPEKVSQYYAEDGHATPPDVQQHLIDWFRRWLLDAQGPATESAPWRGTDMLCTVSGQVNLEFPDAQSTMQATLAEMDALAPAREKFCAQDVAAVQAGIRRLLGIGGTFAPVQAVSSGGRELRGFSEYRFQLNREGEFPVPVIIRVPENVKPDSAVEIRLSDRGKAGLLGEFDRYDATSDGTVLVFADLRGMGESADPAEYNLLKYWNQEYRIAATSLHVGRPLPGQRVVDVLTLLDFCDQDEHLQGRPVRIRADGLCGPVVAHAAVLDKRITEATLSRSLRTWRSYLENPLQYDMLSNVVPGALRCYDLPDLVRLGGGRITYGD
nr:alpha/beta hydrolase family protein [Bacteroidales bacterium]